MPKLYVFAQYYCKEDYPLRPFKINIFPTRTEMEKFSSERFKGIEKIYPKYISKYWILEN